MFVVTLTRRRPDKGLVELVRHHCVSQPQHDKLLAAHHRYVVRVYVMLLLVQLLVGLIFPDFSHVLWLVWIVSSFVLRSSLSCSSSLFLLDFTVVFLCLSPVLICCCFFGSIAVSLLPCSLYFIAIHWPMSGYKNSIQSTMLRKKHKVTRTKRHGFSFHRRRKYQSDIRWYQHQTGRRTAKHSTWKYLKIQSQPLTGATDMMQCGDIRF